MNVWWVNYTALPPSEPGGTRHFSLARKLMQRGHDVAIIASSFHYVARRPLHLTDGGTFRFEKIRGVPFLWLKAPSYATSQIARVWSWLVFGWRFWREVGLGRLSGPHVIIGSSPYPFAALAAERVARRHGVPFVLEVRDLWPETLIELGEYSPDHPFIVLLDVIERYLYRRSHRIINLLPEAEPYMVKKGADADRIGWIPNGVDLDMVPTPVPPAGNSAFCIMYAGAHGLANGLDVLLDAALLLQEDGWGPDRVVFRLVGDGPEKDRLRTRVRREEIDNVEFHDSVPKSAVYQVLGEADAFLMHLQDSPVFRWGVSPNKLFDYMACARPVIFAVGTNVNPVDKSNCGITVPPEDPGALVTAVKELVELPAAERWKMGCRGRQYVEEHHALSRLVQTLERTLQAAVAEGR